MGKNCCFAHCRMNIFLVSFLAFISPTLGSGGGMMAEKDMQQRWASYKAMEACYGEDITKTQLLKKKRAIAKCSKTDMPELDLPMNNSPYRAIQALLSGAKEMEAKNMARFQDVMKVMQQSASGSLQVGQQSQTNYVPVPFPLPQPAERESDAVEELMKKLFVRKVMKRFFDKKEEERDQSDSLDDFFGLSKDDEKFAEMLFLSKNGNRFRRQSDLYELGDRLSEKLQLQKAEMNYKMGNMSCVLKELRMVDEDMELDLEAMLNSIKDMNIRDTWLLQQTIEDTRTCYAYAQSLPQRIFDEMSMPEQWVKIKMYKKCIKMAKYQTCMDNDIKKKLEENFGPLEKLVETTGLPEKEFLPMAMRLLHGDMDMI